MLWQIISFELRYRLKRPATYIYFILTFLIGFLSIAWEDFASFGAGGQIKVNSSFVMYNLAGLLSIIPFIFISSAIMGVPIVRDYEHRMESILYSTNLKKFDYLIGRFIGSFIILLLISLGGLLGPLIASFMPWINADKLAPFSWMRYFHPYLFLVSSLVIQSLFYFAGGILGKRMLFVYLQSIVFTGFNLMSQVLLTNTENLNKAGIIDVTGSYAQTVAMRYWTIAEKNNALLSFGGVIMWNRVLWTGIALAFFLFAYWKFAFRAFGSSKGKKKKAEEKWQAPVATAIPAVVIQRGPMSNWLRFVSSVKIYSKEILKSLPFLGIVGFALFIFIVNAGYSDEWYGTGNWPVTGIMLEVMQQFSIYIYAVVVYYSGELVWREKDVRIDQIHDALPVPDLVKHLAKLTALMLALSFLYSCIIIMSVLMQAAKGFFQFNLSAYIQYAGNTLVNLFIVACVAFFFQLLVKNKFIGFILTIAFLTLDFVKDQFGFRHPLMSFNSGSLGRYSDMNRFSTNTENFFWLKAYWLGFGLILFSIAVLLSVRGTEGGWKRRLLNWRSKFDTPIKICLSIALILFFGAGARAFVNYNRVNIYETEKEQEQKAVRYENELKKYETALQPQLAEINLKVDLVPEKLSMHGEGFYYLKNTESAAIPDIYIQIPMNKFLTCTSLVFDKAFSKTKEFAEHRFTIYHLQQPLQPGDSIKMSFVVDYKKKGFGNADNNFVENGTFFDNTDFFPLIGYAAGAEMTSIDKRKKYKLPERINKPDRSDSTKWEYCLFRVKQRTRFDVTVSTTPEQMAIAPGYLQKEWTANGRRYFHYKMDQDIFPFFSIVSAKYAVKKDVWNGVNLELYYHPEHSFNADLFITAMKDAFAYNSANFGPYQYRQMRILEFPRYRGFAQSFPNTVPYSEVTGFIMRKLKPDDLDMAYYVTAHELGHQWWGHQVTEAGVRGGQMFSESLSQYSSLMLLRKKLTPMMVKKYLKYELDSYLRQRSNERKYENPISLEDGQGYIYYQKGTLVFYTLQDYIGEDKVNAVLKQLVKDWGFRQDRYPTTDILVDSFKVATPDSLKYLVDDMFNKIVLYDNKAIAPKFKKMGGDEYEVSIPVSSVKYYADSVGNEKKVPLKDLLPIGVIGKDKNGKDSLLAIQKVWISNEKTTFKMRVKGLPSKAGIDPLNMFVDRDTNDNVAEVTEE